MWLSRMISVGRPFGLAEDRKRILDALEIVGIADPQHVPSISQEARRDILGESDASSCPRW